MFRVSILTATLLLSAPALAQTATQLVPPSPGTIEDPSAPIKLVADGPPRPLIRMDAPDKPKTLAAIQDASTGAAR